VNLLYDEEVLLSSLSTKFGISLDGRQFAWNTCRKDGSIELLTKTPFDTLKSSTSTLVIDKSHYEATAYRHTYHTY